MVTDSGNLIRVTSGGNSEMFPFAGRSVAEVRASLESIWNIDADAQSLIDGAIVNGNEGSELVGVGSEVTFGKALATKG